MAEPTRVFVVPGEGNATAVPDRIRAHVALNLMRATAGEALASAAGVGLGLLLSLEELDVRNPSWGPQLAVRQVSRSPGGFEMPVEPGAATTTVRVRATFQIAD